jgi:hypothetical protein
MRDMVDDFHAAALANGGSSEGAPGLRLHYGPDFCAAYVRDLDGNKLAAVCRGFHEAPGELPPLKRPNLCAITVPARRTPSPKATT